MEIFESFDNKKLALYVWETPAPRAVVQIVHGMTEHAGRYAEFAAYLNTLGFTVAADDHRGHGETDRKTLGGCAGDMFADTVEDMACLARLTRARWPGVPYGLLALSYGSFLTPALVRRHGAALSGAASGAAVGRGTAEKYRSALTPQPLSRPMRHRQASSRAILFMATPPFLPSYTPLVSKLRQKDERSVNNGKRARTRRQRDASAHVSFSRSFRRRAPCTRW